MFAAVVFHSLSYLNSLKFTIQLIRKEITFNILGTWLQQTKLLHRTERYLN